MGRLVHCINVLLPCWCGMHFAPGECAKLLFNVKGQCSDNMDYRMQFFQVCPIYVGAFRAVCDLDVFDIEFLSFIHRQE